MLGEQDQRFASWTGVIDGGASAPPFLLRMNVFMTDGLIVRFLPPFEIIYRVRGDSEQASNAKSSQFSGNDSVPDGVAAAIPSLCELLGSVDVHLLFLLANGARQVVPRSGAHGRVN